MSFGILIILIVNCVELLLTSILFFASFTPNLKHLVDFKYKVFWLLITIALIFLIIFAFIVDNTMFYWLLSALVASATSFYFSKFVNVKKLYKDIDKGI